MPDRPRRRWFDPLGHGSATPGPAVPPVGDALGELARRRGWRSHLAAAELQDQWDEIVGAQLANHTAPLRLQGGVLVLAADSALWAAEARQLDRGIIARVNERLGAGTVRTMTVSVRRQNPR